MARNKEFKTPESGAHKRLCFEVGRVGSNPASAISKSTIPKVWCFFVFKSNIEPTTDGTRGITSDCCRGQEKEGGYGEKQGV